MAQVTFTPNPQPAPACYPSDVNGLLDMITTGGGISGTVPDTAGGGVFVGPNPPSSSLTNKVWYKTDAAGRPLGVYMFYNGNWRKVYTGAAYGEIRMFWYYSGMIDGTGRGVLGGDMDGWALCNGQNGTPNLEGYFPVCGQQGETVGQASGQWFTDADGVAWRNSGGQRNRVQITMANLPPMVAHTHIQGIQQGTGAGISVANNNSANPDYQLPITDASGNSGGNQTLPFQNLYIAIGFFMFVAYQ